MATYKKRLKYYRDVQILSLIIYRFKQLIESTIFMSLDQLFTRKRHPSPANSLRHFLTKWCRKYIYIYLRVFEFDPEFFCLELKSAKVVEIKYYKFATSNFRTAAPLRH